MLALQILLGLLALAAPVALYVGFASRDTLRPSSPRSVVATFALGMLACVPAELCERALTGVLGPRKLGVGIDLAALVYAYLVAAPLEEALKVAAATPAFRLRVGQHRPIDAISYAAAAALGFMTLKSALFLIGLPFSLIAPARTALTTLAATCLATWWGFALGRDGQGRMGGGWFNAAWALATAGNAIAHHVAFARGPASLLATIPILVVAGVLAWIGVRDVLQRSAEAGKVEPREREHEPKKPRLLPLAPPSLRAMREALRRSERPLSFFWIGLGMLVTTGMITAMLVGAVLLGRRLGFEFASIDRDASNAVAPLLLLASAALLSFLFAGWIVARASAARSVLEPAISALLAIVGTIVLLGLAAPVAVVIALACAPLAFALACLGAWLGLSDA
ncbi:protease PrsW [Polyangium sorediatum]|uniref:Protease PrsW n=1 Tax=Polyangium sorediatum TaxID=889274 RepID=A0ABT6NW70_9BACT|nr:protease PrsW [Polyangium sorediatum]MDI1432563.1 protease PrsW [Polyangium sorediatum]